MKISRITGLKSCPRVSERNSVMAEIASESESYLSGNESDRDSISVLFLLVQQQCHLNKKMWKDGSDNES